MKKTMMETNGMFVQNVLQVTTGMIMKESARPVALKIAIFVPQSLNAENVWMDISFNMMEKHAKKSMNTVQFQLKSTTPLQMTSLLTSIATNAEKMLTLTMKQRVVNHAPLFPTVLNVQMQQIVKNAAQIGI